MYDNIKRYIAYSCKHKELQRICMDIYTNMQNMYVNVKELGMCMEIQRNIRNMNRNIRKYIENMYGNMMICVQYSCKYREIQNMYGNIKHIQNMYGNVKEQGMCMEI